MRNPTRARPRGVILEARSSEGMKVRSIAVTKPSLTVRQLFFYIVSDSPLLIPGRATGPDNSPCADGTKLCGWGVKRQEGPKGGTSEGLAHAGCTRINAGGRCSLSSHFCLGSMSIRLFKQKPKPCSHLSIPTGDGSPVVGRLSVMGGTKRRVRCAVWLTDESLFPGWCFTLHLGQNEAVIRSQSRVTVSTIAGQILITLLCSVSISRSSV